MINLSNNLVFVKDKYRTDKALGKHFGDCLKALRSKGGNIIELEPFETVFLGNGLVSADVFSRFCGECLLNEKVNQHVIEKFANLPAKSDLTYEDFLKYSKAFVFFLWKQKIAIPPRQYSFFPHCRMFGDFRYIYGEEMYDLLSLLPWTPRGKCYRFLQISDWKTLSDICIDEVWAVVRTGKSRFNELSISPISIIKACALLPESHITKEDADILRRFSGSVSARVSDDHFLRTASFAQLKEHCAKSFEFKGQKYYGDRESYNRRKKAYIDQKAIDSGKISAETQLKQCAETNQIQEYFAVLGRKHKDGYGAWISPDYYSGRTHVQFDKTHADWVISAKLYIQSLKGGSSTLKAAKSSIFVLLDYVLCYLPWWFEKNGATAPFSIPKTPEEFKRVLFWKNETAKAASFDVPVSAIEFFKWRRSQSQVTNFILYTFRYFEWIRSELPGLIEVGACKKIKTDFQNPVNPSLDSEGSGERRPTDKIAFPIRVMPVVIEIYRAIEGTLYEFQQKIIKGTINLDSLQKGNEIDLSEYGLTLEISVPGQPKLTLRTAPNALCWHEVKICRNEEEVKAIVPFLSVFRMLRANLHSGQRMQNIQWLDVDDFDKYSSGEDNNYFSSLYLTIDKVDPGRTPLVPKYIMETLVREKEFQLKQLADQPIPVDYELNKNSTYNKIRPLFRSPASPHGAPFNDGAYRSIWVKTLMFIEKIFNKHFSNGEPHQFLEEHTGSGTKTIQAIHTPHSMRNTYILYRKELVDLQLIIKQTGQTERVALHYAQAQPRAQMEKLLEAADRMISNGIHEKSVFFEDEAQLFDNQSQSASSAQSAIRTRFKEDRSGAINEQRMITIHVPDFEEFEGETGLKKLKVQQETQIAYFNECVCPMGGLCPNEVLWVIEESRRCGLCPLACFGIDHIPGILAKTRKLLDAVKMGQHQLASCERRKSGSDVVSSLKRQIRLNALEASALLTVSNILKQARESALQDSYISRKPDLVAQAIEVSIDLSSDINRFVSKLVDATQFPEFVSEGFMSQVERMARRICIERPDFAIQGTDDTMIVASYIASIMRGNGLRLDDLSSSPEIKLLSNPG